MRLKLMMTSSGAELEEDLDAVNVVAPGSISLAEMKKWTMTVLPDMFLRHGDEGERTGEVGHGGCGSVELEFE